ncbi:hypothetical protein [uncultured Sphingomonas sp.]|uniref:hypothetical protein n=1 Tax=uncultured Sphingomonas sp. TaxID=158754 RepID=UPI0035CABA0D
MRESEFFAARADAAQAEADTAVLDNVRERSLRAQQAWNTMAQRSLRSEGARDAREAASASAQAAAADSSRPDFMLGVGDPAA